MFMGLMGVSILAYVILDGYDLGVGILMSQATDKEKDIMIASIGPFWDANETWVVLGIGILLVAFPIAHGMILTALYLPVTLMLTGLILRGVSFDFRAKARAKHKHRWDRAFMAGSILATVSQGYMLGSYVVGFEVTLPNFIFGILAGICLASGYCLVGASWLIMKTENELQKKSVTWAHFGLWGTALGIAVISLTTPMVSTRIFEKWFTLPELFFLFPTPLITAFLIIFLNITLRKLPQQNEKYSWLPFAGSIGLFFFGFIGLGYSFYPYIVPERLYGKMQVHMNLL